LTERNNWARRNLSTLGIYYHLCKYGESSRRPFCWLGLMILFSTIYWIFLPSGNDQTFSSLREISNLSITSPTSDGSVSLNKSASINSTILGSQSTAIIDAIESSLIRTFTNILQIHEKPGLADIMVRVVSIPILAVLAITLRRDLERRFRH
jgi:hypothetical protein